MNDFPAYIEHLVSSFESAGGTVSWPKRVMAVLLRDQFACRYCGEITLDAVADHVIPLSGGGSDEMSNLVCACHVCNASKGAKGLAQWLAGRIAA